MKTIEIGPVAIGSVPELPPYPAPATLIFANSTPGMVARGRDWLDERFIHPTDDLVYIDFHSFVVRSGDRTILIDTCHGNHKTRRPPVDYAANLNVDYLGNLARAGLKPDDIDIVLCTHLHFDHIGWNTQLKDGRWVPTFPKARYLISRKDFQHFEVAHQSEDSMEREAFEDSILPIVRAGQADLIETEHTIERELGHGVWIEGAPGHTPGLVTLHVQSGGRKAIFSGDVIHHPLQIMEPELHLPVDWNVEMAIATRRKLIESCADRDTYLLTAHFPDPVAGRVVSHADGFRFKFEDT